MKMMVMMIIMISPSCPFSSFQPWWALQARFAPSPIGPEFNVNLMLINCEINVNLIWIWTRDERQQ